MINLFKSKFTFRTLVLVLIFFGAFTFPDTISAYKHTLTLKLGSTGSQVVSLQNRLGVSPTTGNFDYTTRGAVVTFQLSHGLVADGIVGSKTGTALSVSTATSSTPQGSSVASSSSYLPGCTANTEFSATTGKPCKTENLLLSPGCVSNTDPNEYSTITGMPCLGSIVYQAGCTSEYGYSITTGRSCLLPIGCISTLGYSNLTGKLCSLTNTYVPLYFGCSSTTGYSALTGISCATGYAPVQLSGYVGSINSIEKIQGFSDIEVPENTPNALLVGYTILADAGSDIMLSSVKIILQFTAGDASHNLNKYASNISVLLGGRRAGHIDVSSLSKNGSTYNGTIRTSDAVIGAGEEANLFIGADTMEDISFANEDNAWTITLSEIRYTDATQANISDSSFDEDSATSFHFLPVLDNDD